jgi:hypothetical protein
VAVFGPRAELSCDRSGRAELASALVAERLLQASTIRSRDRHWESAL